MGPVPGEEGAVREAAIAIMVQVAFADVNRPDHENLPIYLDIKI
jgi:hypothetical protein